MNALLLWLFFGTLRQGAYSQDGCQGPFNKRKAALARCFLSVPLPTGDQLSSDIQYLNLGENNITSLPKNLFKNLVGLHSLVLSDNGLTSIYNYNFKYLGSLKELIINNNQLGFIEEGSFDDLKSLEHLSLQNNYLTTVSDKLFKGSRNIITLNLAWNRLTSLEKDTFINLKDLASLLLSHNSIKSFKAASISHLRALTELYLSYNPITSIEYDDVEVFLNLKQFSLRNCSIKLIADEAFSRLPKLMYLDLHKNELTAINDGMFKGLNYLEILYLSDNKITFIAPNSFGSLTELRTLHLSSNPITEIGPKAFSPILDFRNIVLKLDKNFLCCSRVLYESLSYIESKCTYQGALEEYNSFVKEKCSSSFAANAQGVQKEKVVQLNLNFKVPVNSSTKKNQNPTKRVGIYKKKIGSSLKVKQQWWVENNKKIKINSQSLGYDSSEKLTVKRRERNKNTRLTGLSLARTKQFLISCKKNYGKQFRIQNQVGMSTLNPLFKSGINTGYNYSGV
ncbi:leucine-rich repeat-containing protein 15-like [Zophobas morio]|uniref:leucine-rich repeat-containing protein 15-like n=1 Tax=Zophobas morio TaxID=2755281 RepID=UPI00308294C5